MTLEEIAHFFYQNLINKYLKVHIDKLYGDMTIWLV